MQSIKFHSMWIYDFNHTYIRPSITPALNNKPFRYQIDIKTSPQSVHISTIIVDLNSFSKLVKYFYLKSWSCFAVTRYRLLTLILFHIVNSKNYVQKTLQPEAEKYCLKVYVYFVLLIGSLQYHGKIHSFFNLITR